MYQAHGWWFPDQDTHFAGMLKKSIQKGGGPVYQQSVRQQSIDLTPNKTLALDIGANVGLWSRDLTKAFAHVISFEPVSDFRDCLVKNVPASNLEVRGCALGEEDTFINMIITVENTGHSHVDTSTMGHGTTPMYRLDSLELPEIDYIKIDCEGYENTILRGARQTIMRDRPVMVVEHKRHKDVGHDDVDQALNTLIGWGAHIITNVRNDYILGWR
jgi:FkbM family methyltransferase